MTPNNPDPRDSSTSPVQQQVARENKKSPLRLSRLFLTMRRYRKFAMFGVVGLCLVWAGWWGIGLLGHVTENDARVKADMVIVSSRVDGWIIERPVTDGQAVDQGQEMIVIDQREADLKLAELRAKAEAIRLRQERIAIQHRMMKTTAHDAVTAAQANQQAAASKLEQARREFNRAAELLGRMVSREVWEQRQTQLRQAEAEALSASSVLADAQVKLGDIEVLHKELDALAQEAAQVESQIRKQEIDVADRRVRSPINGIV
ncbi:MAG: biotin/lipoyl-binding protein, partial [Proteobacteria bacterium]|nr:biotin/lipoyl-binding protein [Pseudomonadota bacterium]